VLANDARRYGVLEELGTRPYGQLSDQGEERMTLPSAATHAALTPAPSPPRWIDGQPALGQVTDDVARR
jgi:hypothetical protein